MMKKSVKILSLILACVLVVSLCACGKKTPTAPNENNTGKVEDGKRIWYLGGNNAFAGDVDVEALFAGVADTVDPAKIYSSVELTEEMLHGAYTLNNKEKDLKTVRKEIPFKDVEFKSGVQNLTILPTAVYLGAENISSGQTKYKYSEFKAIKDQELAVLELATADQVGHTPCIYEIDGNKITFKQIEQTSTGDAPFAYGFTGVEFSYTFELAGPHLTFSKDGYSLKLTAFCMTENTEEDLAMTGYSLPDSPLIQGVDYFASASSWNYAVLRDGTYIDISAYKLDEDGRFTAYFAEKDLVSGEKKETVQQYAYIIQSEADTFFTSFSIILLDGSKVYYYTDDITEREARALEDQGADVDNMTDEEIEDIAEKKADLFDELQKEFEAKGINATVNRSTGEIALDATVLFGVNESAISDEGKAFLQKFMGVYTTVVFGEKYKDFISRIMVEGHTDTSGSYELNQTLSKARADSVKEYCLSDECGIDAAYSAALQSMLETVGYAYDKPIYDANGEVDMAASRRVSFRFVVNLEKQET